MSAAVSPAAGARIRVLIVDDSTVMRTLLRMTLDPHPEMEIAGIARDGAQALESLDRLRPDLMLLDIEMPGMNGLDVLTRIRERHDAVRIIMCSTLTRRGAAITLEALARGATDYVTKPEAQHGVAEGVETLTRDLIPKILALFPAPVRTPPPPAAVSPAAGTPPAPNAITDANPDAIPPAPFLPSRSAASPGALLIGVSTGGPAALERLLPALPADFSLPVLIVQHMPQLFTSLLAERLNLLCPLAVREAIPGARPEPGTIWIARGDWHMEVTRDLHLQLRQTLPEHSCRPSVDVLFRSAAAVWGAGLLGVILTGMGSDGLAGCRTVREAGGTVFVQDRATSAVWGMPGVVAEAGLAHMTLPLGEMAGEILHYSARRLFRTRHEAGAAWQ
ncbi:protein-glutamate methylesterase/protein-glutamine glutaminase [Paracidobacterium acidisoli]|uniref:Protein-glutamate methylesterase/protein-glutamine glutaminase n=1 Tax=Paracidobacterium acidisoli TaxID=2303751 RepID=A0A372IQH4_9BACT|nr:chemotaxis response regulator protein-glutamate methylesterase [Paracidobacterium acidisoli]MBT9331352.1 chemotaxis response regulator protein-glutamate methylesterase [Paracidobacterium acidisoli]